MDPVVRNVLTGLRHRNAPASPEAVAKLLTVLASPVPEEYRELLLEMDGCEGPIGEENYVMIYSVEGATIHAENIIRDECPHVAIFASNGGDIAYGFDTQAPETTIVQTSHTDPTNFPPEVVAQSLREWIEYLQSW